jgi:hypothetical protein
MTDPDVYRQQAVKADGMEYYKLLLVYVDDILIISHHPQPYLDKLQNKYQFALSAVGLTECY